MKSKLFFAAAAVAALGLGSCSQDQVLEQSPVAKGKAIEFGTYLGNTPATRGVVTSNANFDEFAVTAFSTEKTNWATAGTIVDTDPCKTAIPNFFYNQKVIKTGEAENPWTYSPVKYWPTTENAMITFFAHHPVGSEYAELSLATAKGTPQVTVTVADETEKMIDFIADAKIDVKRTVASEPNTDVVQFQMNHEMTRLAFTAALDKDLADDEKTTVVIKSIAISATDGASTGTPAPVPVFYKKGTYTFANENDDSATPATINRGKWTLEGGENTLVLNKYLDFMKNQTYSNKTYNGQNTIGLYGKKTVDLIDSELDLAVTDSKREQYLFFIPPVDANGAASMKSTTITVDYDIVTADESLKTGYSCTSATKTLTTNNPFMVQGKAYLLNFTFSVDEVKLSATVNEWDDEVTYNGTIGFTETSALVQQTN